MPSPCVSSCVPGRLFRPFYSSSSLQPVISLAQFPGPTANVSPKPNFDQLHLGWHLTLNQNPTLLCVPHTFPLAFYFSFSCVLSRVTPRAPWTFPIDISFLILFAMCFPRILKAPPMCSLESPVRVCKCTLLWLCQFQARPSTPGIRRAFDTFFFFDQVANAPPWGSWSIQNPHGGAARTVQMPHPFFAFKGS